MPVFWHHSVSVESVLPPTYYADLPTVDRVRMLVEAWGRAVEANAKLEAAFDDQTKELEIACEGMTHEQLTEFRHRAYPKLYPR